MVRRKKFGPIHHSIGPRYTGIRTYMKLPNISNLENVDIAIIGLPFDTATSYRSGSRFGPSAIREISMLLRPANSYHKINPFDYCSVIDYGDLPLIPGYIHDTYEVINESYSAFSASNVIPIGLGGDHSITLGELRGLADKHGALSLVQFDAHGDTWHDYWGKKYTHGTTFRRAAEEKIIDPASSIQIGLRGTVYNPSDLDEAQDLGFDIVTADELRKLNPNQLNERIKSKVGDKPVFLTFDIDFFDPSYAPGTGTPEPGGFTSFEGIEFVRNLPSLNFKGFDLVEVLPSFDHAEITTHLGASIIYEFISLLALQKKNFDKY